ncbi:MAG: hypothetical protein AAF356_09880 [Planctomycetota bacterium]
MNRRAVLAIDIANPTERDQTPGAVANAVTSAVTSAPTSAAPPSAVALGVLERDGVRTLGALAGETHNRRSDGVLALVAQLFEMHTLRPSDLARVIVTVGPGGYTATRVGVTAGVTLAHACGADIVGVPCWLGAWWGRDRSVDAEGRTLIALAGKRDSAHLSIVEPSAEPGESAVPRAVGVRTAEALTELAPRRVIAGRHLPGAFEDGFAKIGVPVERVRTGADVLLSHAMDLSPAAHAGDVRPLYAREPDAVTQWRTLHPGAFSDAEPA